MDISENSIALATLLEDIEDKFSCYAVLPDGKVVMVPWNYPAVALFDPVANTLEVIVPSMKHSTSYVFAVHLVAAVDACTCRS